MEETLILTSEKPHMSLKNKLINLKTILNSDSYSTKKLMNIPVLDSNYHLTMNNKKKILSRFYIHNNFESFKHSYNKLTWKLRSQSSQH